MEETEAAWTGFEPEPLRRVLEAFARAHGRRVEELGARDAVSRPDALARELAALGLAADLGRLRRLRPLVGALVPLLERRPRAHH